MAEHTSEFIESVRALPGYKWSFRNKILAVQGASINDEGNVSLSLNGGLRKTITKQEMAELEYLCKLEQESGTNAKPLMPRINGYDHNQGESTVRPPLIKTDKYNNYSNQVIKTPMENNHESLEKPEIDHGIHGSYNAGRVNDILESQLQDIYDGKETNFEKVRALNDTATKIIDNGRLVLEAQKLRNQLQLTREKSK